MGFARQEYGVLLFPPPGGLIPPLLPAGNRGARLHGTGWQGAKGVLQGD